MSNLIYNEQVKYVATAFNNIGVAAVVGGVVLPLFSLDPEVRRWIPYLIFAGLALGGFLIAGAYNMLKLLKE